MGLSPGLGLGRRNDSGGMLSRAASRQTRLLGLTLAGLLAGVLSVLVVTAPAAASPPKAVTCGDTITAPGNYFLASDCSGDGIKSTLRT
jgi:hypothetical protein